MGKKILVIDDNTDILEIITITLQCEGFEVISHDNPDVLSELEKVKPDIILLDNRLGLVNGSDLCKTIKASAQYNQIPIILVSAVDDLGQVATECNADAYLSKPFDLIELETVVKQFT
jgi:DNA-binding response OmpR family regulator